MSSSGPQCAGTLACVPSTREPAVSLWRKGKRTSKPLLPALYGQDSIAYAAALFSGGGPEGVQS
jgi:hypothetical protein